MIGWLVLIVAAGLIEFSMWKWGGGTLSQHFWREQRRLPILRYVAITLIVWLLVHLAWEVGFPWGLIVGVVAAVSAWGISTRART